jgi:DNA-binding response OmpR family regulator
VALSLLVLDDDDEMRQAVARRLARDGFNVTTARSIDDARQLSGYFDFGVFDVDLPDGDGVNLATEMVKLGALRRVVFFTTADENDLARAAGVGTVVPKDEGMRALTRALLALIAHSKPPA